MFIKVIDWIGRFTTLQDIGAYVLDKYNEMADAEQKRIQQAVAEYKARGFSQKAAEASALWDNNLISDEGYQLILQMEKK